MRVLIVHAHPEPKSFNAALTQAAAQSLRGAGHEVRVSDLYAARFDPVSDRRNFTTTKDASYYKQQVEEAHAAEVGGFAPDVRAELDALAWCDTLIFQFPLWWFGLPAVLKGWVDRVFAAGVVYGGGRWYDKGTQVGKRAMCSLTTGGPASMYASDGLNGDMNQLLYPINHGVFAFTGFAALEPHVVWSPARMNDEQRREAIATYARHVLRIPTLPVIAYPKLDDFDASFRLKR